MTKLDKVDLPTGHKSVGDGIVYNEGWDETAEMKKSEKEESEIEEGGVEETMRYNVGLRTALVVYLKHEVSRECKTNVEIER